MAVRLPEEMPQPSDAHHVGHVVPMKILVGVFSGAGDADDHHGEPRRTSISANST